MIQRRSIRKIVAQTRIKDEHVDDDSIHDVCLPTVEQLVLFLWIGLFWAVDLSRSFQHWCYFLCVL